MLTLIPDSFAQRFPFCQTIESALISETFSNSESITTHYDPVQQKTIIYNTLPITSAKADPYNKKFFTALFAEADVDNLLVVFPNNKAIFTLAKMRAWRKAGIMCQLEAEYQTSLNELLINHSQAVPITTPNTSWAMDTGSATEDSFYRNTSYAIPDSNRYNTTFTDPNGVKYTALSDAFSPILSQQVEIKPRGLNILPDRATCKAQEEHLRSRGTYDTFTALWYGWSNNLFKQKGVSEAYPDQFVILFPDSAFTTGKVSALDEKRMADNGIQYNSFSGYQQHINNNVADLFPELIAAAPALH